MKVNSAKVQEVAKTPSVEQESNFKGFCGLPNFTFTFRFICESRSYTTLLCGQLLQSLHLLMSPQVSIYSILLHCWLISILQLSAIPLTRCCNTVLSSSANSHQQRETMMWGTKLLAVVLVIQKWGHWQCYELTIKICLSSVLPTDSTLARLCVLYSKNSSALHLPPGQAPGASFTEPFTKEKVL